MEQTIAIKNIFLWNIHMEYFIRCVDAFICHYIYLYLFLIENFNKAIHKCCIIFIWYIPMEDFSKLMPKCGHKPSKSLEYSYGRLYVIMWH